ncbi:MAG: glycosyltransferase family 2 protein [Candidatus Hydrogenedentes bacterium]|nr:glycosyltransferase family 2 protein [Candidatus Hydrogenedentota bacterium]
MSVDVIIASYNTRELLRACLASVERAAGGLEGARAIVVDNASADGSAEMVRAAFPRVAVIALEENLGFGPANNRGMHAGDGAHLLFLNSDAELKDGALRALVEFLDAHPNCVAVGPRLEYPDGRFQPSCRRFPALLNTIWNTAGLQTRFPNRFRSLHTWLSESEHVAGAKVEMVSGACFLVRRDYLESVGGFDENIFLYEEEMDILLPARRRGLDVCYCPSARVVHHHGASSGGQDLGDVPLFHLYRSKYYAFGKHYGPFAAWAAFAAEHAIFTASARRHARRGLPSTAARLAEYCAKGYAASREVRRARHGQT